VTDYESVPGNVEPSQRVQIRTRATGYLRKVCFRTGQVVKQGDLLFEIDPATYQIDVQKAKAEVTLAQAKLNLASAKSARVKQLNQLGNAQSGSAAESEQERQMAEAELQVARANLELAEVKLSYTHIRAPISGYISSSFDVGSLVKAEQSDLATIVCLDPVYVVIQVAEGAWFSLRKRVQRGEFHDSQMPVEISVPQAVDFKRNGFLEFIEDAAFNAGATMMRVRVPNKDAALVAGLFVVVRCDEGNRHRALLVPEKALDHGGELSIVWVVNDQNILESRAVRLSASVHEGGLREVARGLKADEWFICDPSQAGRLVFGTRIEPKRVP